MYGVIYLCTLKSLSIIRTFLSYTIKKCKILRDAFTPEDCFALAKFVLGYLITGEF